MIATHCRSFPRFLSLLLLSAVVAGSGTGSARAQAGEGPVAGIALPQRNDGVPAAMPADTAGASLNKEERGEEKEKKKEEAEPAVAQEGGFAPEAAPETPAEESDSAAAGEHPRQSVEEYHYAGSPRYTLIGKPPYRETHVEAVPAILTGTVVAGIITGIHVYQQDAWWKDRRTGFHFQTDWGYAAQADKVGHFFAGYFTSYIGYESLVASGFSSNTAGWLGPLLAVGFQTYVEVEDGFSPFGFDPTDQVANMVGPMFLSAQNYVPFLQNFKFKWSYFPSDRLQNGEISGHNTIVIDDYNGQTIWLTAKVSNFLPKSLGWPEWLRLAVGYGAYNVDQWNLNDRGERELLPAGRRFYVSLDYNLVDMLPDLGSFGNWLVQTADFIHWPAPALEFGPDLKPKFLLLYPIEF